MSLSKDQATAAVRASVARGSCTPRFGRDREEYEREKAASLEEALIEPIEARIVRAMFPEHGVLPLSAKHQTWCIAQAGAEKLIYLPATGEFLLAYGSNLNELSALGFYSDDVLAEWLG